MDMLMRVKIEGPKKQADYCPGAAVNWGMDVRTAAKETIKLTLSYTFFNLFLLFR